jgi:hypothetical protein
MLPEVQDALVDNETLDDLLRDWTTCCELLLLRCREDGEGPSLPATADGVRQAIERLRLGDTRGLQLRYRYADGEWCDTLMPHAGGAFRLVRIAG